MPHPERAVSKKYIDTETHDNVMGIEMLKTLYNYGI